MIGNTLLGLFFTPVLFVIVTSLAERSTRHRPASAAAAVRSAVSTIGVKSSGAASFRSPPFRTNSAFLRPGRSASKSSFAGFLPSVSRTVMPTNEAGTFPSSA